MGLIAAANANDVRRELRVGLGSRQKWAARTRHAQGVPFTWRRRALGGIALAIDCQRMCVCRHFRLRQCDAVIAKGLADGTLRQPDALALVTARTVGKVGELERGCTVASVLSTEQGKKWRVLLDWKSRTIAECPLIGREVETEQLDLAEERLCHSNALVG